MTQIRTLVYRTIRLIEVTIAKIVCLTTQQTYALQPGSGFNNNACSQHTELGSNSDTVIVTIQIAILVSKTIQQTFASPAKQ